MSKKIVDEVLKYTVEVNGNEGQKELFDLEKRQRKLTEANKELRAEKRKMIRQNKQGTPEWKALTAELRANSREVKANKSRMAELRKEIGLTALTPRQLKQEASRLRLALNNMIPGSADAKRYEADLKKVNARLTELRMKGQQASFSLKSVADRMNRYQTMGLAVVAATTGVVVSLQKYIDFNHKLADAQSNVEKTTGLTREQVDELTKSFGLLKTRSARIELLAIAEEAGRLGKKSIPEILAFTKTADMIKVALGDDLQGDINENVRVIGKLAEQYQIGADIGADFGESMTMIGSAINEVSASGSNQAGFLVDILKRTVGMATQADIAADKIIGLAAAADESGQSQEITATALNKTFIDMAQNVETYAAIAGRSTQEFAQLINDDAYEALLVLLEGLKGNNGGLVELASRFDQLGVDGTRTVQVLGALSNNIDLIRTRQGQANKALNEATSLYDEFLKKNTNFAAVVDRLSKKLRGFILNNPFTEWLKNSITFLAKFVGAIEDTDGSVTRLRERLAMATKIVLVAATAVLSYKAALKLSALWANRAAAAEGLRAVATRASAVVTNLAVAAQALYITGTNLLTGKIKLATAAQRAFNIVLGANPFAAIAMLAATATAAYIAFANQQKELTASQQVLASVNQRVAKATVREKAALDALLITARNEALSKKKRLAAMEKLQKLAPDYLGNIELEELNTLKAKKAIEQYIKALEAKAMAEALQEKRVELYSKRVEAQLSEDQENLGTMQKYVGQYTDKLYDGLWGLFGVQTKVTRSEQIANENRQKAVKSIDEQIKALNKLQKSLAETSAAGAEGSQQAGVNANPEIGLPSEGRKEAALEIQDFLDELNQSEVEKVRAKYKDMLALAEKYNLSRLELEQALQKELEVLAAKQMEESALAETERQVQLMESSMQQIWDAKYLALLQQAELEKWNKEQLNEELFDLETQHLNDVLAQRKKLGLDTADLEVQLLERKRELNREEKQSIKEKELFARTQSAFSAAAQARDAEDRKDAVLAYIRQEIQAIIARGIAKAVESMLGTGPAALVLAPAAGLAAGALFSSLVPSFNSGQYEVMDQHGHNYRAQRDEQMLSGLYSKPTVSFGRNKLVAERGQELIVDPAVTKRLLHVRPEVIEIIRQERKVVHGYAQGDYSALDKGTGTQSMEETNQLLRAMLAQLNKPSVALIPGQTRRYANTLNDLENQIRQESKLNS